MGMPGGTELLIIFGVVFFVFPLVMHFRQERVYIKNELGMVKEIPAFFSWTSLIFGFWVPLLRGDFKWFFIYLILTIFTYGIGLIVVAFFYNRKYIESMLEKGYKPKDEKSKSMLIQKGIILE